VDLETGRNLGPNKKGELCFTGPYIMKGYYGDPQATAAIFDSDGFLHTGDVGYYDEDGFFYVVDRVKELIKYKGYQVKSIITSFSKE
jgi:long-subunit acyl-CoA synthetase (AMP-forming)